MASPTTDAGILLPLSFTGPMRRFAPRLLLFATLAGITAGAEASRSPPLPGPAPQARSAGYDVAAENHFCASCHTEIAAEWQGSMHHSSWDDGVFQTAYAVEPIAFCRNCHVPEADPNEMPAEDARRLGIGCVTCHVESGEVVGSHARGATKEHHAVRGDARLATSSACERCHQFEFPEPQRAPMQSTADEHQVSKHATESCQHCHMLPVVGEAGVRHRSHDFRVIGNPALLRSALLASGSRIDERAVNVALAAARVGHAFPTGDMFRRLEVRAQIVGEGGAEARPVVLSRRFEMAMGNHGPERKQIGDDRLAATAETRDVRLQFSEALAGRAVNWQVVYQRMDAGMATAFGLDPVADEVVVADGLIPAESLHR